LVYQGDSQRFVSDVRENRISDLMADCFAERWGHKPGFGELNSWQNSLSRVRDLIEIAGLKDTMVALEYEVPYNQNRIDCMLFGKGERPGGTVVLIELKQWTDVKALEEEGNFVETFVGGSEHVVPHPAQQVKGYHHYLQGFVSEFDGSQPLQLVSCAYCHNYKRAGEEGFFDPIYHKLIDEFPVYTKEDVEELASRLKDLLAKGHGFEIFNRFMRSPIRPSKKLLDNVAKVVKNEAVFSLLNEQLVAKYLIWSKVRRAEKKQEKSVVIVHGGPGTGKSVIAINLLSGPICGGRSTPSQ